MAGIYSGNRILSGAFDAPGTFIWMEAGVDRVAEVQCKSDYWRSGNIPFAIYTIVNRIHSHPYKSCVANVCVLAAQRPAV